MKAFGSHLSVLFVDLLALLLTIEAMHVEETPWIKVPYLGGYLHI